MLRILPFAVEAIILVFCLIDVIMSSDKEVRNLPKWAWILIIIVLPLIGGVTWLILGRPQRSASGPGAGGPTNPPVTPLRPKAPDDDPEFLASLKAENSDHERMLKQWEENLRRREEELRRSEDNPEDTDPTPK